MGVEEQGGGEGTKFGAANLRATEERPYRNFQLFVDFVLDGQTVAVPAETANNVMPRLVRHASDDVLCIAVKKSGGVTCARGGGKPEGESRRRG